MLRHSGMPNNGKRFADSVINNQECFSSWFLQPACPIHRPELDPVRDERDCNTDGTMCRGLLCSRAGVR